MIGHCNTDEYCRYNDCQCTMWLSCFELKIYRVRGKRRCGNLLSLTLCNIAIIGKLNLSVLNFQSMLLDGITLNMKIYEILHEKRK